jgi:hypothetical protein
MDGERGAGWWQASDGSWYPPSAHSDPAHRARWAGDDAPAAGVTPPSTGAPPPAGGPRAGVLGPRTSSAPSRARSFLFGALTVAVVVGVGVAAFLLAGGAEDDVATGPVTRPTAAAPAPTSAPDETTTQEPTTSTTNLGDLVTSGDVSAGALRFELPDGWITAAPGSGARGAVLFPQDEQLASAFDTNLQVATDSGAILFGLESDLGTEGLLQVHLITAAEVPGGLDEAAQNGRTAFAGSAGTTLVEDQPIATGDSIGHLFRYTFPGSSGQAFGVQILAPVGTDIYVLTFSTADAALADELVAVAPTCHEG